MFCCSFDQKASENCRKTASVTNGKVMNRRSIAKRKKTRWLKFFFCNLTHKQLTIFCCRLFLANPKKNGNLLQTLFFRDNFTLLDRSKYSGAFYREKCTSFWYRYTPLFFGIQTLKTRLGLCQNIRK